MMNLDNLGDCVTTQRILTFEGLLAELWCFEHTPIYHQSQESLWMCLFLNLHLLWFWSRSILQAKLNDYHYLSVDFKFMVYRYDFKPAQIHVCSDHACL